MFFVWEYGRILMSIKMPVFFQGQIKNFPIKMVFLKWLFGLILKIILYSAAAAVFMLVVFNWPVHEKNENMEMGLSFSSIFARDIGLDWKKTYLEILDDLKPKRIRVAAYWSEVEKQPGQYDFSDVDFQLAEAAKRNIEVILVFGMKTPRWPECFVPGFYGGNEGRLEGMSDEELKKQREDALIVYEKALVEKYKNNEEIKTWQVENEPFLAFGQCPGRTIDLNLLDREIAQVRSIDKEKKRKIMVTDSGELSLWINAAKRADIFGTTLYRVIYKKPYGYVTYPLGPMFFRLKSWPIRIFGTQNDIIVCELQAEPWGPKWITDMDVEEQYKSMNPQRLKNVVDFSKKTNFSQSYLWGAEWWYWLKEKKGNSEMWETGKEIITDNN
jgi:hypothetical protein